MNEVMVWQPLKLPAYTFQPGDRVRRVPDHPRDHTVSTEVGTVEAIYPPSGVNYLGTVVVRYADKVIAEGTRHEAVLPRRTWHMAGNLAKVDE